MLFVSYAMRMQTAYKSGNMYDRQKNEVRGQDEYETPIVALALLQYQQCMTVSEGLAPDCTATISLLASYSVQCLKRSWAVQWKCARLKHLIHP